MNDRDPLHYYDLPNQRPDLRAGMEALRDRVLTRADALEADQRALLRIILDQGSSYQQVARLRGEHATTVSRRFRRLLRKLSHGTRGETPIKAGNLAPLDKTILSAYYLFGMNQSQIAARLGISRYRVRKSLDKIATPTAKHPSSLPELRRTESLTVPPDTQQRGSASSPIASDTVKCATPTAARSITVAAQERRRPCTR